MLKLLGDGGEDQVKEVDWDEHALEEQVWSSKHSAF